MNDLYFYLLIWNCYFYLFLSIILFIVKVNAIPRLILDYREVSSGSSLTFLLSFNCRKEVYGLFHLFHTTAGASKRLITNTRTLLKKTVRLEEYKIELEFSYEC